MVVQVAEELAVFEPALLEPGAVVGAELLQRLLNGDRLDLTHVYKRTEAVPGESAVPLACHEHWQADGCTVTGGQPGSLRRHPKPTMTSVIALIIEWR